MESHIGEIIGFLRHDNVQVRKKALEAMFTYSGDAAVIAALSQENVVKSIKAALFELVVCFLTQPLVHTTLLLLLNASSNKKIVEAMDQHKVMDPLLQIIFNVMKTVSKEDLNLKKHLMMEVGGTRIGDNGEIIREIKVNPGQKMTEDEVVTVMNLENLRLSLLIISNMCSQTSASRKQLLQLDNPDEKVQGSHFIVLLGWFLVDEYELLFENFAPLLNTLTEEDELKDFLLNPTIRLETRIKRYLIHDNHVIRGHVLLCMKHIMYSHENPNLEERYCKFKDDEVHIIELNCRCLYRAMKERYDIKENHVEIMEKAFGSVWKPIKTLKSEDVNKRIFTPEEEIEHSLDVFLASTNFDFMKYFPDGMAHLEQVRQLRKTLAFSLEYLKEPYLRDKVTATSSIYTGDIMM